jgi:hypothetical protein
MIRGVRPLSRRHKERASKRKTYLKNPPSTERPEVFLSFPFITPQLTRDMEQAAVVAMMQAMFKENLFPSTDDLARLAETAIGDTVEMFAAKEANSTSSCYMFTRYLL